jgi:hypothetical protein
VRGAHCRARWAASQAQRWPHSGGRTAAQQHRSTAAQLQLRGTPAQQHGSTVAQWRSLPAAPPHSSLAARRLHATAAQQRSSTAARR